MTAKGEDAHPVPIEGVLDLHTFRPQEAAAILDAFLEESHRRGWREVRIIHGKGIGTLRQLVHTRLKNSSWVRSFRLGDEGSGSWGATWVELQQSGKK